MRFQYVCEQNLVGKAQRYSFGGMEKGRNTPVLVQRPLPQTYEIE